MSYEEKFSMRLDPKTKADLDAVSASFQLSSGDLARRAIREYLEIVKQRGTLELKDGTPARPSTNPPKGPVSYLKRKK